MPDTPLLRLTFRSVQVEYDTADALAPPPSGSEELDSMDALRDSPDSATASALGHKDESAAEAAPAPRQRIWQRYNGTMLSTKPHFLDLDA
jgi:hypothetical protein